MQRSDSFYPEDFLTEVLMESITQQVDIWPTAVRRVIATRTRTIQATSRSDLYDLALVTVIDAKFSAAAAAKRRAHVKAWYTRNRTFYTDGVPAMMIPFKWFDDNIDVDFTRELPTDNTMCTKVQEIQCIRDAVKDLQNMY